MNGNKPFHSWIRCSAKSIRCIKFNINKIRIPSNKSKKMTLLSHKIAKSTVNHEFIIENQSPNFYFCQLHHDRIAS